MATSIINRWLPVLAVGVAFGQIGPAAAALGGDTASVAADAAGLRSADQTRSLRGYVIHELTADSGLRVREFADQDGRVFAVSWNGPVMPDLHALLGGNYASYEAAVTGRSGRGLLRSQRIVAANFIVETGGHMRAYTGRAYLPAAMPGGTPLAELR